MGGECVNLSLRSGRNYYPPFRGTRHEHACETFALRSLLTLDLEARRCRETRQALCSFLCKCADALLHVRTESLSLHDLPLQASIHRARIRGFQ